MEPFSTLQTSILVSLVLGVVRLANALTFTDSATDWVNVVSGTPFEVTWYGNTGNVGLFLANGTETDMVIVHTLETILDSNAYAWTPGIFAIPGHTFFLFLNDSTGAQAFSPAFTVLQVATTTTSSQTSTSTSSTSSPTSSSTSTPASSVTATPTSSPTAKNGGSSGLSTGAKAGIGIGAALGVILIALILGWLAYRHRNANKNAAEPPTEMDGRSRMTSGPAPVVAGGEGGKIQPREMDGGVASHELP